MRCARGVTAILTTLEQVVWGAIMLMLRRAVGMTALLTLERVAGRTMVLKLRCVVAMMVTQALARVVGVAGVIIMLQRVLGKAAAFATALPDP